MIKKTMLLWLFACLLLMLPVAVNAITQEDYKTVLVAYQQALTNKDFATAQEKFDVIRLAYEEDVQSPAGRTILANVGFDLQPLTFNYDSGSTKKFKQLKAAKTDPNDFISYNAVFLATKKTAPAPAVLKGVPMAVEAPAVTRAAESEKQLQLDQIQKDLAAMVKERDQAVAQRDAAVAENKQLKAEMDVHVRRLNDINSMLLDAMR